MNFALGEDIRSKYLIALFISLSFPIVLLDGDMLYHGNYGDFVDIPGCTDPDACNYNPDATRDDGSCYYIDCNVESTFSSTALTSITTL